ncbi:MAG: hypothetical protein GAK35_03887 [Herbaspirillum frisingense]|uniref:Shufflon system plasmid conjugative transfer pilus tip adhesin PilV n=1 Tax=Herbaspirillum frisingense TaxID=92645 RepID=A0A7V8JSQ4_9BURK|nr:MAG: hypothetical protein GAK35_03887 [Herbaspirillum frisingense]
MVTLLHSISRCLLPAPRRSISLDPRRHDMRRRQRGFALGQALVATAMLGGISAVGTDWASQYRQTAALEAQNATYARINNGVGVYMTLYYPQIIDRSTYPDSCAEVSYGTSGGAGSGAASCSFAVAYKDAAGVAKTRPIKNILQPTLADLQALGLVDAQIPAAPLLPVNASVITGAASGAAPAARENIYGIMIKRVPTGTDVNLDSLVFNVQPYTLTNADMSTLLRMSNGVGATSGLPDRDSRTSSINPQFDLKGYAGAWNAPNPVKQGEGGSIKGMPGILAWRNGYAAAASLELIRRDGSLKPTADWDFDKHSITNLNQLQAKGVTTETLTTDTLTANGAAQLNGTLDVKGTLTALGDMVVKGASDIQALVVHGPATFEKPVTMQNSLTVNGKVTTYGGLQTAYVNVDKGPQIGTLGTTLQTKDGWVTQNTACALPNALAQDANGRLMLCSSGKWQTGTNNVYGLTQVNVSDSCSPNGAAGYLPNGLMAICRSGKWQAAAIGTQVSGKTCATQGMMAAEITAQGVANLLVCQTGGGSGLTWSPSIYARPKAEIAKEGAACRTDQINALARSDSGNQSGILMCTSNDSGGAQWQVPFGKYVDNLEAVAKLF